MRKSRYTEEQIIGFHQAGRLGLPIKDLCRKGGFSDATFYKWRVKCGEMDVPDARRLRELWTQELSSEIVEIAHVRRRFGYRGIHDMLRPHFPAVNHKKVYRLCSPANLAVRKRKKAIGPSASACRCNCEHGQCDLAPVFQDTGYSQCSVCSM